MADEVDHGTVKVIELMGVSQESWDDAVQNAVDEASETIEGITGVEVMSKTADVENGQITEYKATVHVSFPVQR